MRAEPAASNRPAIRRGHSGEVVPGGIMTDLLGPIGEFYGFQYSMDTSIAPFIFFENGTLGGSLGDVRLVFENSLCIVHYAMARKLQTKCLTCDKNIHADGIFYIRQFLETMM